MWDEVVIMLDFCVSLGRGQNTKQRWKAGFHDEGFGPKVSEEGASGREMGKPFPTSSYKQKLPLSTPLKSQHLLKIK